LVLTGPLTAFITTMLIKFLLFHVVFAAIAYNEMQWSPANTEENFFELT